MITALLTPNPSSNGKLFQQIKDLRRAVRKLTPNAGRGMTVRAYPWGTTYESKKTQTVSAEAVAVWL